MSPLEHFDDHVPIREIWPHYPGGRDFVAKKKIDDRLEMEIVRTECISLKKFILSTAEGKTLDLMDFLRVPDGVKMHYQPLYLDPYGEFPNPHFADFLVEKREEKLAIIVPLYEHFEHLHKDKPPYWVALRYIFLLFHECGHVAEENEDLTKRQISSLHKDPHAIHNSEMAAWKTALEEIRNLEIALGIPLCSENDKYDLVEDSLKTYRENLPGGDELFNTNLVF